MKSFTVHEMSDWDTVAAGLLEIASADTHTGARVITLAGDLGAGKTTLVQHVARACGITANVTSPTFVIMQKYLCTTGPWKYLVHIDAYRLENETPENIAALKLDSYFADPENLICIEWAEYVADLLPKSIISVIISQQTETMRHILISE